MSTTTLNPTADSYVRDGTYASTNYGSASDIQVKYSSTSGQGYNRIGFLEFDLSSVSSVGEAVVKLYGSVNNSDVLSIGAYPIASPTWGQSTITWNNQPSPGTLLNTTTVSGTSDNWYSWDLTGYLQAQKAAGHNTVSVALIGTTSTGGYGDFDAVESGTNEPQLIISSDDASLTPTNDAYVQDSTYASTNFGSATSLLSKKTTGVNNRNIYVTYDTSGVTGSVSNAYLQFTGGIESGGTDTNVAVNVYGVSTTSWSEGTITWNNAPSAGGTVLASNSVIDTTSRVYTFDVSSYVNAQRAAGHDVVSFMIQAGAVTSSSIIDFNSKEASSGKPALVLSESGPSVATPAAASPSTVTGATTSLSVLGADPAGESSLTYTWYTVSQPTGGSLSVSATGTNAAKNVTAYFAKPGTYSMYALITDPSSNSISSNTLTFTVVATLSSIALTPTAVTLGSDGTQQFAASGLDQFGVALASQPTFTWTNSGVGSVNSTGLYTAPAAAGSDTVTATSGSVSGNASVTVGGPSVATAASASTSDGINIDLAVLGSDPDGESTLTYTWASTSVPSGATVDFGDSGDNTAKSTRAAIDTLGTYTFQVTISDGTNSVTSSVSITIVQVETTISAAPGGAALLNGANAALSATAYDQFGAAMSTQPTFTWGGVHGSVTSAGYYTAPSSGWGADTITATGGGTSGAAQVAYGSDVGSIYDDANDNGTRDTGEEGVMGLTVYEDENGNGVLDSGEPYTTTDLNGDFTLAPVSCGCGSCQSISFVQDAAWTPTTPTGLSADPGDPTSFLFGVMAANAQVLTSTGGGGTVGARLSLAIGGGPQNTYIGGQDSTGPVSLGGVTVTVAGQAGPSPTTPLTVSLVGATAGGTVQFTVSAPTGTTKGTYYVGFSAPGWRATKLTVVVK